MKTAQNNDQHEASALLVKARIADKNIPLVEILKLPAITYPKKHLDPVAIGEITELLFEKRMDDYKKLPLEHKILFWAQGIFYDSVLFRDMFIKELRNQQFSNSFIWKIVFQTCQLKTNELFRETFFTLYHETFNNKDFALTMIKVFTLDDVQKFKKDLQVTDDDVVPFLLPVFAIAKAQLRTNQNRFSYCLDCLSHPIILTQHLRIKNEANETTCKDIEDVLNQLDVFTIKYKDVFPIKEDDFKDLIEQASLSFSLLKGTGEEKIRFLEKVQTNLSTILSRSWNIKNFHWYTFSNSESDNHAAFEFFVEKLFGEHSSNSRKQKIANLVDELATKRLGLNNTTYPKWLGKIAELTRATGPLENWIKETPLQTVFQVAFDEATAKYSWIIFRRLIEKDEWQKLPVHEAWEKVLASRSSDLFESLMSRKNMSLKEMPADMWLHWLHYQKESS